MGTRARWGLEDNGMRGRWIAGRALGGVTLALGLAGGAAAESVGLVADGIRPELFLLYTGDVIGHLDPCG